MSEAAIVKIDGNGLVPSSSGRAIILDAALEVDTQQREILAKYVSRHMKMGLDYGVIPGTQKPSLLKPGAEKLVDLFRCTPKFKLVKSQEDFDRGFFNYMFRVQLVSRDANCVLAEGFGSCNSREGRYRWRNSNRVCPTCGKETIIKGDAKYGGGWVCWKKKDGCGSKFGDDDQAITNQAAGKVENDDIATMANTILKMAKKRALVDGAIALARCSDMFTQDVEDFVDAEAVESRPVQSGAAALKQKVAAAAGVAPKASPPRASPPRRMEIQDNAQDERPEPPPVDDRVAASPRDDGEEVLIPFGKNKGQPLSSSDAKGLNFLEEYASRAVDDPDKARFRDSNERLLAAVLAEKARRKK